MMSRDEDFPEDLARRRARERFASARKRGEDEDWRVNRNRLIALAAILAVVAAVVGAWLGARR